MREEASLFQPDVCLPNKVSIAIDKEHNFYNRPGRIPDVSDLTWGVFFQYFAARRQTHFIIKAEEVVIDQQSVASCSECSERWSEKMRMSR